AAASGSEDRRELARGRAEEGVDTLSRLGVDVGLMPGGGGFVDDLRAMIDAGRAFGRHPLWLRIAEGQLPRSALGPFAVQFFLQVREFPRAVSALHSSCPDTRERIELAESLYEEETGRISGCNVSHPELFIRFGEGVGVPPRARSNSGGGSSTASPAPSTRADAGAGCVAERFFKSQQRRAGSRQPRRAHRGRRRA